MKSTQTVLKETRAAFDAVRRDPERKNAALRFIADRLLSEQSAILSANREDLEAARSHYGQVMLDRLTRLKQLSSGLPWWLRW